MSMRAKIQLGLAFCLVLLCVASIITNPPQTAAAFIIHVLAGAAGVVIATSCLRTSFNAGPRVVFGSGVVFLGLAFTWAAIPTSGIQLTVGNPVTVKAIVGSHDQAAGFCDRYAISAGSPATVPLPSYNPTAPVTRDIEQAWVRRVSAVDISRTLVEVQLQGKSDTAVRLHDPVAIVDSQGPATTTTTFAFQYGCGSGYIARHYAVQLDLGTSAIPLTPVAGDENGPAAPPPTTQLQVSNSDPETLEIEATTTSADVRWHIEIPWDSSGRSGTVKIYPANQRSFITLGDLQVQNNWVPVEGAWREQ